MLIDRLAGAVPAHAWPTITVAGAVMVVVLLMRYLDYDKKVEVPVIGPGGRFTKWLGAIRNVWYAREAIHEVANGQHGKLGFQIPTMTRMDVFICDRALTREYYSLDEDHMSFRAVMSEEFQFKWLLPGQHHDVHRIPNSVIAKALSWQRTRASKADDPFFREFSAEFLYGFQEEMRAFTGCGNKSRLPFFSHAGDHTSGNSGWIAAPCFPLALKVIARLTTKSLFGEPLCRNPKFLDMCCEFGDAVPRDAMILRCFPDFIRPLLARFLAAPRGVKELQTVVLNEITSRRNSREKNPMKDLLDFSINWIDEHSADGWEDWHIADMMTNTVFAALHTSSQLVTHTLFELATRPEYVVPLREEIRQCFALYGNGTKAAIDAMHKMDSFIKETQRCNPLDASALARLVLKPYTFSNGLHVPKGSFIFTPNSPLFEDEQFYEDAKRFDGLRFARMRDDPKRKSDSPMTATSEYSMHFGIGRHACPGRYMVSDEVKLVMVHLLLHYDFAMANFGPRPKNMAFGKFILPDMQAKVWLRKSKDAGNTARVDPGAPDGVASEPS
uniref:Cytochrome P450 monooxygeanse terQ n=1 Tax=Tolypocladium album TaxID=124418 RepID=TERQ_TOLAL|nr:cytochrome P450 monooxygenase [Tolypocladium album]